MPSANPMTLFSLAQHGMSAQLVRMNAAASNLANAGSISGSAEGTYRPLRPVFTTELDQASGLASVNVTSVIRSDTAPLKEHMPDNPLADADGNVWSAPVDENAEMIEMLDASRQYQNLVEAMSTAKQLMLDTMRMK